MASSNFFGSCCHSFHPHYRGYPGLSDRGGGGGGGGGNDPSSSSSSRPGAGANKGDAAASRLYGDRRDGEEDIYDLLPNTGLGGDKYK
jgi:hypothetical protein